MDRGIGVRRCRLTALACLGVLPLALTAPTAAGAHTRDAAAACDPEILLLPAPDGAVHTHVSAMNDTGLVVGSASDGEWPVPSYAVLWQAGEPAKELGIGGVTRSDGSTVHAYAVDVNEAGFVAVQRRWTSANGRRTTAAALLWDEVNGKTRLPTTRHRTWARIEAINDLGVAVGAIDGTDEFNWPVPTYWRNGRVKRLPLPPGAITGDATDINNRGMIIGSVQYDPLEPPVPWWWRRGARNGPLSIDGLEGRVPYAGGVDDRDRIVGEGRAIYVWRNPTARPRQALGAGHGLKGTGESGLIVGVRKSVAWVARLGDEQGTALPDPALPHPDAEWRFPGAFAVIRGTTPFAPQGGITVGGQVTDDAGNAHAVLWTCAQTYFD